MQTKLTYFFDQSESEREEARLVTGKESEIEESKQGKMEEEKKGEGPEAPTVKEPQEEMRTLEPVAVRRLHEECVESEEHNGDQESDEETPELSDH